MEPRFFFPGTLWVGSGLESKEVGDSAWTYLELLASPAAVACSWIQDPRILQCSVYHQPRSASTRGNELGCWLLLCLLAATSQQVSRALKLGAAKVRITPKGP